MIDPITEADLTAYVDGELDPARRLDVEAHLARMPHDAARVMADLRDRDALREAFGSPMQEAEHLRRTAKRLERRYAWQRVGHRLRRAAVIALLVGTGWLAHNNTGSFGVPDTFAAPVDPILVEEAAQAREALTIRARVRTLRPAPTYERADLEAATGLRLPELPAGWSILDVQVFPARNGAGVEVSVDTSEQGDLALFATRATPNTMTEDWVTQAGAQTTAYWQVGQTCYALTGSSRAVEERLPGIKVATKHL